MSEVPFHYVELRAFAHPTEDDDTVLRALRTLFPEDIKIEGTVTESHHGAPILVLSARVENADDVRAILGRLGELPTTERQTVLEELEERVDEDNNLYLSLSKQAAAVGDVELGDGITFRAKIEAYPAKHAAAVENARGALEEL
ncbi:MAG: RNA-binding protein [Haloarculaceae archaeon]